MDSYRDYMLFLLSCSFLKSLESIACVARDLATTGLNRLSQRDNLCDDWRVEIREAGEL
ncbi:hypothetical protein OIU79_007326 [Salix purpurea]|uniref:Uncharacterized protein n=1 Tax=Salix purpurea TaxID=77065 RepID=A0A9Q0TXK2_SALPP|nr:hypothetical protein OIU79_007326 [Salix purpurea]